MFNLETIVGIICMLLALAGIFLAGLQIGYKIGQEDIQEKQNDENNS